MLPDVQTRLPDIKLPLTRVGVSNVRKLLRIPLGKKSVVLLASFDCFVDLPSSQKGTHMSRNLEAINELLEDVIRKPVHELEGICGDLAAEVLRRHDYATKCEVAMESKRMLQEQTPSGRVAQNFVKLLARAMAKRDVGVNKEVGAEVRGILVHPHIKDSKKVGTGSSQRARASLILEVPEGHFIKIEDIVEILEGALSSKAYGYLSEGEEEEVLASAYGNPKSVDGVVKDALRGALEKFSLPDNAKVEARCIAEEALFPHDSMSERRTRFGELRKEFASKASD